MSWLECNIVLLHSKCTERYPLVKLIYFLFPPSNPDYLLIPCRPPPIPQDPPELPGFQGFCHTVICGRVHPTVLVLKPRVAVGVVGLH